MHEHNPDIKILHLRSILSCRLLDIAFDGDIDFIGVAVFLDQKRNSWVLESSITQEILIIVEVVRNLLQQEVSLERRFQIKYLTVLPLVLVEVATIHPLQGPNFGYGPLPHIISSQLILQRVVLNIQSDQPREFR